MPSTPSFNNTSLSQLKALLLHPILLGTCIALLSALYFADGVLRQRLILAPQNAALQAATSANSSAAAQAVNSEVEALQESLRQAANQPQLKTALASSTRSALESARRQLATSLPEAQAVHLIDKSKGFEDQSNFLAKTLVNIALNGERPPPSTMKRESWLVLMTEPIFAAENTETGEDKNVIGAVLSETPLEALTHPLKQADSSQGKLELIQRIPGLGRQTLIAIGVAGPGNAAKTPISAMPGWQVSFTASKKLIELHRPDPTLIQSIRIALGLLSLLCLALTVKLLNRRLRVKNNSTSMNNPDRKSEGGVVGRPARREADFLVQPDADEATGENDRGNQKEGNCAEQAKADPLDIDTSNTIDIEPPDSPTTKDVEVFDLSLDDSEQAVSGINTSTSEPSPAKPKSWPPHVFREYDIRGLAEQEIDEGLANALGQTLGTRTLDDGKNAIIVGRDGRLSSPALAEALIGGILMTGCDVIDLGLAPTPAVNFACRASDITDTAVIVTASHNPGTFNGFKLLASSGTLHGKNLQTLREDMLAQRWLHGEGTRTTETVNETYLNAIYEDIEAPTPLHVVVDCGNGVAGTLAPALMEKLGCDCIPLYCDVDGAFPNHSPDPTQAENLADLVQVVAQAKADLGLAFDGDGDRLVAVSASGRIVWPDELMMIFSRDIVARDPGCDIVFDVKSTRRLANLISDYGGRPVMWKTGHAHIREKVSELQAPLGGEFSGHLFFNDRWHGFDDGLYAAARLLEILSLREQSLDALITGFDTSVATSEIRLPVAEALKFSLMEKVVAAASFEGAKIDTLDGLRVDFERGWGLVRASNTDATLTLRFEADDDKYLGELKSRFKRLIASVNPELEQSLEAALSPASADGTGGTAE